MPSRSKKNQAERLRKKRFWAEVEAAGALIKRGEFAGQIDVNKLDAWRRAQGEAAYEAKGDIPGLEG